MDEPQRFAWNKLITGEFRVGVSQSLVVRALAAVSGASADVISMRLMGDWDPTPEFWKQLLAQQTHDSDISRPYPFYLAYPLEGAIEDLGDPGEWQVEWKWDGIRAQLIRRQWRTFLWSRGEELITDQFPEVAEMGRAIPDGVVLDGEILAWRDGAVLPFIALQARLGRKDPSAEIRAEVPVIYVAWDVLGLDAETADQARDGVVTPTLELPLTERRRLLQGLRLPLVEDGGGFALSYLTEADSTDALEAKFADARARRNEGLMVKDPTSIYSPGRRGYGWLKMKKALATIDCVVVGVEVGHGKRHGVLSDYTFAVRDEPNDRLVTIGKAYSGLTDAEIATMTRWFEEHTISHHGRYRVVEPVVVVEVAFDVILRSNRHKSGFALRFPRIAHLRLDKPAAEADTLETVTRLYEGLQAGAEHLVTAGARKSPVASR
jgi:DNA ligase-1